MKASRAGQSWSGHEQNKTFLNTGTRGRRFADVSSIVGLGFKDDGRALAVTDWDGDGDLDLWSQNRTAPRLRLMRNNSPRELGSLCLKLEGAGKSNRDAIGARLVLELSDGTRSTQTLRAGSGFLSQSSKWQHFGLGADATPQSLEINWPDGTRQLIEGLERGGRYRIRQGEDPSPVAARAIAELEAVPPVIAESSGAQRLILPAKVPLPNFSFQLQGKPGTVALAPGKDPLLIILFSGSCASCAAELTEFKAHENLVRESGLNVLALSVDGLSPRPGARTADALITETQFPFPTGEITLQSADHLRMLLASLHDFPPDFVVPLGLLLDEERRLYTIYRGPVSPQQAALDKAHASAGAEQLRDLAVPFAGRWFTPAITPSQLAEFLAKTVEGSFPIEGLAYWEHALAGASDAERQKTIQQRLTSGYYRLARELASANRLVAAGGYFKRLLELDPTHGGAHDDYGAVLANQKKYAEAEKHFRAAIEIDPGNENARKNLERLLELR